MPRRKSPTLTELELEIMQVVWAHEEVTVEALAEAFAARGKPLAESSFRTMLSILGEKGYVTRRKQGRGFAYRAAVPAEQAEKRILSDVIDRVFDGSAAGLVAALLKQGMVDEADIARAKQLIDEQAKEGR